MKNILKKYMDYMILVLVVIVFILLNYAMKGMFPFGYKTISNGDIGQGYIPTYNFLYDVLSGKKSIFFDYDVGGGAYMYGVATFSGMLSPLTWIIKLGNRNIIQYMFSIMMIFKYCFIALTSYFFFSKIYKNNKFYTMLFSILYVFSGYALMYNTNIMWLEIVGMFPLFLLATKYMFEKNNVFWFGLTLGIILILNYNLAYMVLFFIIFVIPIYIKLKIKKEDRKKAVFNLILGVIVSIGISAVVFIPSFIQAMQSYRLASGKMTNPNENINFTFKAVIFIMYAVPLYGYIKWMSHFKEDKNNCLISIISLSICGIIPVLFERINLYWHTGSYQMFPFRYGFIPIMILYLGALNYYTKYQEKPNEKKWKYTKNINIVILIGVTILSALNVIGLNHSLPAFNLDNQIFIVIIINFILLSLILSNIMICPNKKIKYIYLVVICSIQVLTYIYGYLGVENQYRFKNEWSDESVFNALKIKEEVNIDDSLYRMKDKTGLLSENANFILDIPGNSTFTHLVSKEQITTSENLGISTNTTKINDNSGTLFTDALFGTKYLLTKEEMPDKLYNLKQNLSNNIKLYEYKYTLPIGFEIKNSIEKIPENDSPFEVQNNIYKNMFEKEDNLFEKKDVVLVDKKIDSIFDKNSDRYAYRYIVKLNIRENEELYLNINKDLNTKIADVALIDININNRRILMQTAGESDFSIYPFLNFNGTLDLGYFENAGEVTIEFTTYNENVLNEAEFVSLDVNKYIDICNNTSGLNVNVEKNKITIKDKVKDKKMIFLPINYVDGWKSKSDNVKVSEIYSNYMGIEITPNQNTENNESEENIDLVYMPKTFITCLYVTIGTFVWLAVCHFLRKKFDIRNLKVIMFVFWILGIVIFVVATWKIYVMSILNTFLDIIHNIL